MNKKQLDFIEYNWIPALRSGDYEQANGALRKDDRYCCLGVACNLFGVSWSKDEKTGAWGYPEVNMIDGKPFPYFEGAIIGHVLSGKTGVMSDLWYPDKHTVSLSEMNDNGHTFDEIADELEKFVKEWRAHVE